MRLGCLRTSLQTAAFIILGAMVVWFGLVDEGRMILLDGGLTHSNVGP